MSLVLARIKLRETLAARRWIANPYAVHQRLCAAFPRDQRLLFRIEDACTILVQAHQEPNWAEAFSGFDVVDGEPEHRPIDPMPQAGAIYRFRLLANPVVARPPKSDDAADAGTSRGDITEGNTASVSPPKGPSKRYGLLREEEQRQWLIRKLEAAGARPVSVDVRTMGHQRSRRTTGNGRSAPVQTHFAVLYEGLLMVNDPTALRAAIETGVGPAKGYGFGLLSLARASNA